MADFHRKSLPKSQKLMVTVKPCPPDDDCEHNHPPLPPPPPPPPQPSSSSSNQSLSPFLIFMFCGLAVSFAFICYLTLTARYKRRQTRRHEDYSNETHQDFVNEDLGPVIHHHPIWLINTIGLDPSEIESIQVFKYKKDESLTELTDCSVCLSEFEDDESLRLLPKCSHAFHVPCIDTWLRSHKNCPLCRAPIITQIETTTIDSNPSEPHITEETGPSDQDSETNDNLTIEVETIGEVEKSSRTNDETYEDSDLVDTRRSISIDDQEMHSSNQLGLQSKKQNSILKTGYKRRGSSSSIRTCSKSSSFGRSLRKTSSFTNRFPQNRSY